MNAPESPFYLAARDNRRSNEEVWYMKAPLGKNEIKKFLSTAAKNAGLQREGKKVTNHSVTKTSISRLLDADVPENFVAQLSAHKSTKSLQSYKSASAKHQKRMSELLASSRIRHGGSPLSVSHRKCILLSETPYNKQLTNRACSGRTGDYWPSVVAVRTSPRSVRTATPSDQ